MCVSPSCINGQMVGCRTCWQCRSVRVRDYAGRCIAEAETATSVVAVTLTYSGDVPAAAILTYRDIQLFLKRLRKDGYKVRYICAGEYGSLKGRAHWHIVLFFQGQGPELVTDRRVEWKYWPHGYAYAQVPEYEGFKYLLKYAMKDASQEVSLGHLMMSKKPPLGTEYFMQLTEQLVQKQLPLSSPKYQFRHVRMKDGTFTSFMLKGTLRDMVARRYIDRYAEVWGVAPPYSEYLDELTDRWALTEKELKFDPVEWRKRIDSNAAWYRAQAQALEAEAVKERLDAIGLGTVVFGGDSAAEIMADGSVLLTGTFLPWHVSTKNDLQRALARLVQFPKAVSNAMAKIEEMAEKVGVKIGRPISGPITTSGSADVGTPRQQPSRLQSSTGRHSRSETQQKGGSVIPPKPTQRI